MEVTAKSVHECSRGKEENAIAPLCTTLKDQNNSFLQRKVDVSFQHCLEALESQILEEPVPSIHGGEHVVRLQVGSPLFSSELQNRAIPALTRAGLVFDVFGIENVTESESQQSIGRALCKSPVVVALNNKTGLRVTQRRLFQEKGSFKVYLRTRLLHQNVPVSPGKQRSIEGDYHYKFQQARIYTSRPRVRIYTTVTNQLRLN